MNNRPLAQLVKAELKHNQSPILLVKKNSIMEFICKLLHVPYNTY